MNCLEILDDKQFPFNWVDLNYYPESHGSRKEIYVKGAGDDLCELTRLFHKLFDEVQAHLRVYMPYWWDYTLETSDIHTDKYDYNLESKSATTLSYLTFLTESSVPIGYKGSCACSNWDEFLEASLPCILDHSAPYSPIFYNSTHDFFFYFHHTVSIGFYFREENETVKQVLKKAYSFYNVI